MYQNIASIQFRGSLVDFTGEEERRTEFHLNPSAKDLIESCGVPHVEIFGLRVNGMPAMLSYNVENDDRLMVIPKELSENPGYLQNIRTIESLPDRLIADVHLGKLARLLRLTGVDTIYSNSADDAEIAERAAQGSRGVLTRDVGLLKHGKLNHGYWLRSVDPDQQLMDVIRFFNLSDRLNPFSRCLSCNGMLRTVKKSMVEKEVPPRVKERFNQFKRCSSCGKIYWKGSHYEKLVKKVEEIEARSTSAAVDNR